MGIGSALVTGGAGAIGIEVCNQLAQRGIEVHLFDLPEQIFRVRRAIASEVTIHYGSVLDSSSLREAMDAYDVVIHLAAMLGVRRTELNKLRCLEINVEGTKRVLDVSIQHRVRKLVFASSSEVYGEPLSNPVDEDAPTQGKTIYAVSKLAGEELCKAYAQSFPWFSYVILRYFNTYGPFQTAQFVVPKFVANILANKPPVIYGDGAQKRSYCYVSDTARATVEAAFSDRANGSIFNIGSSDTTVNLWELAGLVIDVAGKEGQIEPVHKPDFSLTDRAAEREIRERICDIGRARAVLGYDPKISLRDGIRMLLESGQIFERWETTELPYLQDDFE